MIRCLSFQKIGLKHLLHSRSNLQIVFLNNPMFYFFFFVFCVLLFIPVGLSSIVPETYCSLDGQVIHYFFFRAKKLLRGGKTFLCLFVAVLRNSISSFFFSVSCFFFLCLYWRGALMKKK